VNSILVLLLPPDDDRLRVRSSVVTVSAEPPRTDAVPPIQIIVDGGRVILIGGVENESDKNAAGLRVNGVRACFR